MNQRLLAPEVIQTSSMDCGPACMVSVLEGFGEPADYERLRDLCQTDVDGTSIDMLEQLSCALGLEAEQIVLPVEHLLESAARTVPAILVVQQPGGPTHFVVVWRTLGPWVQVMDPAGGRRWTTKAGLRRIAHRLVLDVGVDEWREWAGSEEATRTFAARLGALVRAQVATSLLEQAASDPGPTALAALDAAIRLTTLLRRGGALRDRQSRESFLLRAWERARREGPSPELPSSLWNVLPAEPDPQGHPQLRFTGVVLLRFLGRGPAESTLQQRIRRPSDHPGVGTRKAALARLLALIRRGLTPAQGLGLLALIGSVVGTRMLVALLLSILADFDTYFPAPAEKLVGGGLLLLPLLAQVLLEGALVAQTLGAGRRFELILRERVVTRLRVLDDGYVTSRPRSDLAERLHSLHLVRNFAGILRVTFESGATVLGVIVALWVLDPRLGMVGLVAGVSTAATPLLFFSFVGERDMRLRTLRGSLTIFDLDVLLGASVVRAHRAQTILLDAQEERLTQWDRAARGLMQVQTLLTAVIGLAGTLASVTLVMMTLDSDLGVAGVVLVAYWGLLLPTQGLQLGESLLMQSSMLNVFSRISDLAETSRSEHRSTPSPSPTPTLRPPSSALRSAGMSIDLVGCTVVRGGHRVLEDLELRIAPGEHVAIVGRSGAGKSTLAATLMGSVTVEQGTLELDGQPVQRLWDQGPRADVIWIDPSVQLWNRTLLENLRYGHHGPVSAQALDQALTTSQVAEMIERLPGGLSTPLGEAGRRVSGGEGQRVRVGRSLVRSPSPRLVVLDEAMRGLPGPQRRALLADLRRAWNTATLVCITHDIETAAHFPRVVVLERGRVVEDGDPSTLQAQPGSRLATLLEREHRARDEIWGPGQWRRLHLRAGHLHDTPAKTPDP
ncbi:MAG: ATP-binding cassette domain-containing protein [Myxococcota bacterium]